MRISMKLAIGSGFGLGLSPIAPGTCATLLGVVIHVAAATLLPAPYFIPVLCAALFIVCVAHFALTPWAQDYWQREDPGHFVLDEIAGYLVVPILFQGTVLWQVALWGFLIERALDIIKIQPARYVDRNLAGGWGILLDDLIAGVYTVGCLYVLKLVGPQLGLESLLIAS